MEGLCKLAAHIYEQNQGYWNNFYSLCQPEMQDKTEVEVANVEPPCFKLAPSRGRITQTSRTNTSSLNLLFGYRYALCRCRHSSMLNHACQSLRKNPANIPRHVSLCRLAIYGPLMLTALMPCMRISSFSSLRKDEFNLSNGALPELFGISRKSSKAAKAIPGWTLKVVQYLRIC